MTSNKLSIKEIKVEKLFGYYNYSIPNIESDISKLLILYGDNGCGKTTVLRIIFYLLSTREQSGFKTKLANIKFKKVSIKLENGIEIGASRDENLFGSYTYYVKKNNKLINSVLLEADEDGDVALINQSKEDQIMYAKIMKYLTELQINTFYLTDDRKIHSSITSTVHEVEMSEMVGSSRSMSIREIDLLRKKSNNVRNQLTLEPAIERLLNWIRIKTITGSRIGEKNSQVIFSDIINNYVNLSETENIVKNKNEIIKELEEIERKIPSYVALGLIDNFETKTLKSSIKKAKAGEQSKYLSSIITPFLDSVNAKLKALEKVEQTVSLLISIVNDYFSNKTISFNLGKGFALQQKNKDPIDFNWLSSGEKQLLLLLINVITSSDEATIFIIDEPEISLNIKWQRKLIETLLTFSRDNNVQFILATHSLELLSSNRSNVSKLENSDVR
jgi:predicted ATPase